MYSCVLIRNSKYIEISDCAIALTYYCFAIKMTTINLISADSHFLTNNNYYMLEEEGGGGSSKKETQKKISYRLCVWEK